MPYEGKGGSGALLFYRGLPLLVHYRLLRHDGQYWPFRFDKKSVDYLSDGRISLLFLTDTNPTIALSHLIQHEYDHVSPVNDARGRRA